jgi:hypothetical protein
MLRLSSFINVTAGWTGSISGNDGGWCFLINYFVTDTTENFDAGNSVGVSGGIFTISTGNWSISNSPNLTQIQNMSVSVSGTVSSINPNATNLEDTSTSTFAKVNNGGSISAGRKLNQSSVDKILIDQAALPYTGITINLALGTNSAPSAAGLAAIATLTAQSCTVTTN